MDDSALKKDFDRDGFVTVRQLLSNEEFAELNRELDRYIREVVPTLPDADAFYVDKSRPSTLKQMQHMQVDPYFRDYVRQPKWLALAERLLGEPVICEYPEWFNKPPGEEAPTPPHQDNYYFCLHPPQVMTVWMALDRVNEENGCVRYVPGSHVRGLRPHGRSSILGFSQGILDYSDADRAQEVLTDLQPGDVIVHHGNTIHRAEPNRSRDRHRRAFAMVIKGVSAKRDQAAYQRYQDAVKQQHLQLGLKV
jgi:phytanoyl-CoA hydroxylase